MVHIYTLMMQQVLAEPDWQNGLEPEDLRALGGIGLITNGG